MNTNLDDWETDPDFIRDMDEMDQRWGSKRTVGSINMGKLIDDVRRDHKTIHETNHHSSQKDYASGLDRNAQKPQVSQKTFSREVITEKRESTFYENATVSSNDPEKKKATVVEDSPRKSNPNLAPKPNLNDLKFKLYQDTSRSTKPYTSSFDTIRTDSPEQIQESLVKKHILEERSSTSSPSSRPNATTSKPTPKRSTGAPASSAAFKSIQDKIDAFKREFEQVESKVAKKSDISEVIRKSVSTGKSNDTLEYVTRSSEKLDQSRQPQQPRPTTTSPIGGNKSYSSSSGFRPSSASPVHATSRSGKPQSIKSMYEQFESVAQEISEDYKRRMEDRRRELFDKIRSQVRETRKGLEGFDVNDSDQEETRAGSRERPDSREPMSGAKPKVYTKRETIQEKVVSKFVKENDKVIHDETKRNVEHTSSCHGSSEDELDKEPSSISQIHRNFKTPVQSTGSPISELRSRMPSTDKSDRSSGLMARTLYDYQAAEDDELSFDVDDLISNIEKLDEGWYKGTIMRNGQKRVGLFPANYVKLLNDSGSY